MSLYLTVEIRHDPIYQAGPYSFFMTWCAGQSITHDACWLIQVYDESPVRAVLHVIDLDENGGWVTDPETGDPVTHTDEVNPSALPPLQGYINR